MLEFDPETEAGTLQAGDLDWVVFDIRDDKLFCDAMFSVEVITMLVSAWAMWTKRGLEFVSG